MKVVLDSNVLVAAFAARGLCHEVLETCLHSHKVATSDVILKETHRNLMGKIKLPEETADRIVEFIRENSAVVSPAKVEKDACRDPQDLPVLGTAMAGKADCIVTGDGDLLTIGKHEWIEILSPRDFWKRISRV